MIATQEAKAALERAMNMTRGGGLIGWGGSALRRMWYRRLLKRKIRAWAETAVEQLKRGWRP